MHSEFCISPTAANQQKSLPILLRKLPTLWSFMKLCNCFLYPSEWTALQVGGGHAFGKTHGACTGRQTNGDDADSGTDGPDQDDAEGAGFDPDLDPFKVDSVIKPAENKYFFMSVLFLKMSHWSPTVVHLIALQPWKGTCGKGAMRGKGNNTFTSGFEGPWTTHPTTWSNTYFKVGVGRFIASFRLQSWRPNAAKHLATSNEMYCCLSDNIINWGYMYYLVDGRPSTRE